MTEYQPQWELQVYETDDVTPWGNPWTSYAGGTRPYIDAANIEWRAEDVDIVQGTARVGEVAVPILDKRTGTSNADRHLTALLGDSDGNPQWNGRRARLRWRETPTSSWRIQKDGRLIVTRLRDKNVYVLHIADDRIGLLARAWSGRRFSWEYFQRFDAGDAPQYAAPCSLFPPGPLVPYGGLAAVDGAVATQAADGLDLDSGLGWSPAAAMAHEAQATRQIGGVDVVRDLCVRAQATDGPYADEIRYYFIQADQNPDIADPTETDSSGEAIALVEGEGDEYQDFFPVGTGVVYWIVPYGEPSENAPFHWDEHPATFTKDLLASEFGPFVDGAPARALNANTTRLDDLAADGSWWGTRDRVAQPWRRMNYLTQAIFGGAGWAPSVDADSSIYVVTHRLPEDLTGLVTLDETNVEPVVPGDPWANPGTDAIALATWDAISEKRQAANADDLAPDRILEVPKVVQGLSADTYERLTDKEVRLAARAYRAAVKETRALEKYFEAYSAFIRRAYGYGPQNVIAAIRLSDGLDIHTGDFTLGAIPWVPDPATNLRGGTRVYQVLAAQPRGARIIVSLRDVGLNAFANQATATSLAANATDPNGTVDIGLTVAADTSAEVWTAETDTATATRPSAGSDLWKPKARSATVTTATAVTLEAAGHSPGSRVWVRHRAFPAGNGALVSGWRYPSDDGVADYVDLTGEPRILDASAAPVLVGGAVEVELETNATAQGVRIAYQAVDEVQGILLDSGTVDVDTSSGSATAIIAIPRGNRVRLTLTPYEQYPIAGTAGPAWHLKPAVRPQPVIRSVDLVWDESDGNLHLTAVGGERCVSALFEISDQEDFSSGVTTSEVTLGDGDTAEATLALTLSDRGKRWFGRVTGYNGALSGGHVSGYAGDSKRDSAMVPSDTIGLTASIVFNASNQAVVTVNAPASAEHIYITVAADADPSDPSSASYDATIAGSSGTVNTGVAVSQDSVAHVKVRADDGPVAVFQAKNTGSGATVTTSGAFDGSNELVVTANGPAGTTALYMTVGVDTSPADPTTGSYDAMITGRSGTVNTGVTVSPGSIAYIRIAAYDGASLGDVVAFAFGNQAQPGNYIRLTNNSWLPVGGNLHLRFAWEIGSDTRSFRVQYQYASTPGGSLDTSVDYTVDEDGSSVVNGTHLVEDETGSVKVWDPAEAAPTITITPYDGAAGTGTAGTPKILTPDAPDETGEVGGRATDGTNTFQADATHFNTTDFTLSQYGGRPSPMLNTVPPAKGGTGLIAAGITAGGLLRSTSGGGDWEMLAAASNGQYVRYNAGSGVFEASNLLAADLTGTVASGRLSGSYPGITEVGTLTSLATSSTALVANLNSDRLDSQHGSYYRNANNINAGTLGTAYGGLDDDFSTMPQGALLFASAVGTFMALTGGAANAGRVLTLSSSAPYLPGWTALSSLGVSSVIAGAGITLSGSVGDVTITNAGVRSVVADPGGGISVTGSSMVSLGVVWSDGYTMLDGRYLGISATAANASQLNGQNAAYYRNANNINAGTLGTAHGGLDRDFSAIGLGSLLIANAVGTFTELVGGASNAGKVLTMPSSAPYIPGWEALSSLGVSSVSAGSGISVNMTTGDVIVTNTGVRTITAASGSGISASGTNTVALSSVWSDGYSSYDSRYAQTSGATFTGYLWFNSASSNPGLSFDTNHLKRITWNDGGGNFTIRMGTYYSSGERYIGAGNGGAVIVMNGDASNGSITLKTAVTGTAADDPVTYAGTLSLAPSYLDITDAAIRMGGTTVLSTSRVLQNVTANTSILTAGTLGVGRGGLGADFSGLALRQLLIAAGDGSFIDVAAPTTGTVLYYGGGAALAWEPLSSLGVSSLAAGSGISLSAGTGDITVTNDGVRSISSLAGGGITVGGDGHAVTLAVDWGDGTIGALGDVDTTGLTDGDLLQWYGAGSTWRVRSMTEIGAVPTSRTISAGTGLTGGGSLSANRTISLSTPVSLAHGGWGADISGTEKYKLPYMSLTGDIDWTPTATAGLYLRMNATGTGFEWGSISGTLPTEGTDGHILQVRSGAWSNSGFAVPTLVGADKTVWASDGTNIAATLLDASYIAPGTFQSGDFRFNGSLGINTSPLYTLHVAHGTNAQIAAYETGSGNNHRAILGADSTGGYIQATYSSSAISLRFLVGTSEKMRINGSSGELLLGYTADQGDYIFQANGQILIAGATKSSSLRWKVDWRDLADDVPWDVQRAWLRAFRPLAWTWDAAHGGLPGVGFGAEHLLDVGAHPMVELGPDGLAAGIKDDWWAPLLVAGWQAHESRIETAEQKVARLESENADLRARVADLEAWAS